MEQRSERFDPGGNQLVDEAIVEVEAFGVRRSGSLRKDARPGDGETIGVGADALHQRHVLLVAVIVVVGDVTRVVILDLARRVRVGVPD